MRRHVYQHEARHVYQRNVVLSDLCFAHDYLLNNENELENKKYHSVGTIPKSHVKIDTLNRQQHDCSLYWLGTGTSITSCGIKLVLWKESVYRRRTDNAMAK